MHALPHIQKSFCYLLIVSDRVNTLHITMTIRCVFTIYKYINIRKEIGTSQLYLICGIKFFFSQKNIE